MFLLDAGRGLLITVMAVLIAIALQPLAVRSALVRGQLLAWWLVPALAVAYAWAALPVAWAHSVVAHHLLHLFLSALRFAPVALAIAWCAPPPAWSATSLRLAAQLSSDRRRAAGLPNPRWARWWCGPERCWLLAALLVLPLALAEFELASRLAVGAWAVRLFDAQAGGLAVSETLGQALPVVLLEVIALVSAWWLVRQSGTEPAGTTTDQIGALSASWDRRRPAGSAGETPPGMTTDRSGTPSASWDRRRPAGSSIVRMIEQFRWAMPGCLLALGSVGLVLVPALTLLLDASKGLGALSALGIIREVSATLVFTGVAATVAWLLAGRGESSSRRDAGVPGKSSSRRDAGDPRESVWLRCKRWWFQATLGQRDTPGIAELHSARITLGAPSSSSARIPPIPTISPITRPAESGSAIPGAGGVLIGFAALIGLCGSLPVGLVVLSLLELPGGTLLASTPVPLLVALAVLALPFALVLRQMTAATPAGWNVARALLTGDDRQRASARSLHWRLVGRRRWWAFAALAWWCAWDLASSSILHPVDMTPVLVLLYHFMHYGESSALTVRLLLALAVPALLLMVGAMIARWWTGRSLDG